MTASQSACAKAAAAGGKDRDRHSTTPLTSGARLRQRTGSLNAWRLRIRIPLYKIFEVSISFDAHALYSSVRMALSGCVRIYTHVSL